MLDSFETPYGLSFSPTTVSASRFNALGLLEVSTFSATLDYQLYFNESLRNLRDSGVKPRRDDAYYESVAYQDIVGLLSREVDAVTADLTRQLAREPEYVVVTLPSLLEQQDIIAAGEAVFPAGSAPRGLLYQGSSLRVACGAFGFLQGKHIKRALADRDDDNGPETMVLALEYEKGYLHAGLVAIYWEYELFPVYHKKICFACGGQSREVCHSCFHEQT